MEAEDDGTVHQISQAMPCVGVTMDTHLVVSAFATEEDRQQLWKAGPALQQPDAELQHWARWTQPQPQYRLTQSLLLRMKWWLTMPPWWLTPTMWLLRLAAAANYGML